MMLPLASAWVALIETDWVMVGQFMLSRPLIAAPLLALALGGPMAGLVFGALFELLDLEREPVGTAMPINGSVAAATGVLLMLGPSAVPAPAALPLAIGAGMAHRAWESRLRQRRGGWTLDAARQINDAGRPDWERMLGASIGLHAAGTAAGIYAAAAVGGPLAAGLWGAAPGFLRRGFEFGFNASLWIAMAALLRQLARRR